MAQTDKGDTKKGEENSYIEDYIDKISTWYPFNLFRPEFMDLLSGGRVFVWRVYLLRCQNLAAASTSANIKDRLAGYSAKCTANPYLIIKIGEGNNDEGQGIKYINERDKAKLNNLNPEFYQTYEFEVVFPESWELRIEIWDAGGIISDDMIGYTSIDLEDRYYGNPYLTSKAILEFNKKEIEMKRNKLENSGGVKKDEATIQKMDALK